MKGTSRRFSFLSVFFFESLPAPKKKVFSGGFHWVNFNKDLSQGSPVLASIRTVELRKLELYHKGSCFF